MFFDRHWARNHDRRGGAELADAAYGRVARAAAAVVGRVLGGAMTLELTIYLGVVFAAGSIVLYTLVTGLMPVPTSRRVKSAVLAALPSQNDGTILELGSGWGTLAISLARRYPACRVIGYELSPLPWFFSWLRSKLCNVPNLALRRQDFYRASLAEASLAVCYLFPGAMGKLKSKLEGELRPGTLVVSNMHPIPGWEPESILHVDDQYATRVYVFRVRCEDC